MGGLAYITGSEHPTRALRANVSSSLMCFKTAKHIHPSIFKRKLVFECLFNLTDSSNAFTSQVCSSELWDQYVYVSNTD